MSWQDVLSLSFMNECNLRVVRHVWAWGPWASTVSDHYCTWPLSLHWSWGGNPLCQIPFSSAWRQTLVVRERENVDLLHEVDLTPTEPRGLGLQLLSCFYILFFRDQCQIGKWSTDQELAEMFQSHILLGLDSCDCESLYFSIFFFSCKISFWKLTEYFSTVLGIKLRNNHNKRNQSSYLWSMNYVPGSVLNTLHIL